MAPRWIILGGGISGLSFAYFLKKQVKEAQVLILEKRPRLGGWCHSKKVGDFLFEMGPRCFKASRCSSLLSLLEELGLQKEMIFSSAEAETRYIYHQGKLQKIPKKGLSLLASPLTRPVFFPLLKDWISPKKFQAKETIDTFVTKRLGEHAAQVLFDPFTLGIYAGDSKKLSMEICFPRLHEAVRRKKSFLSALFLLMQQEKQKLGRQLSYIGLVGLKGGNSRIIQALEKKLEGVEIQLNTEVCHLQKKEEKIQIISSQGTLLADHVFVALPKKEAQKLLIGLDQQTFSPFQEMECASVASVNLGYKKQMLFEKAFGYLVPSRYGDIHLGTLFQSMVFPENSPSQGTSLGVMLGGAHHPEIASFSEKELLELAKQSVKKYLNFAREPDAVSLTHAKEALPQFGVNHREIIQNLLQKASQKFPNLTLLGNYLEGVSVNDCIAYSKKVCENWLARRDVEQKVFAKKFASVN